MKYKIVTSGTSKEVTLDRLSRSLRPQSEIYSIQKDGEVYLGLISNKALVIFATEFADYAIKNYAKRDLPKAEVCLSIVRKWIEDDSSVSNEELRTAADAAYAAAADAAAYAADAAAADAANAAANAAYAAYAADADAAAYAADAAAADAADAAAYAAADYAAAYAADAANAADAAAYAAGKDRDGEFIRQGEFILDFLRSGRHLFNI